MIAFGKNNSIYLKKHLVPFGEYAPLAPIINWIAKILAIPMSNFNSGPQKQPSFISANINIAPFICYEIAYGNLVRQDLPEAELLITLTNDAWFGESIASQQHAQIAQMRALETGRYLLLADNNGVSAIIAPNGKIIKTIPQFKTAVLTGKVYAMKGTTPWVFIGNFLLILGLLIFCFL